MGIFMKFLFRTYFFLKAITHILLLLLTTSQFILATKALFMSAVFLMPSPPTFLCAHIESQLLRQQPFLLLFILPHQNLQLRESRFEQTSFGRIRDEAW